MMDALNALLDLKLREREQQGLLRQLRTPGEAIDFYSNDYLGLARSSALSAEIERRYREGNYLNGSTGSRLLGGNYPLIEDTEHKLAARFKSEACILFNSGYSANLAVLSAVPGRGDTILFDSLAHASLKDGARLSLAKHHSFRHNDAEDLERKLAAAAGNKFVVLESVYSMDGDLCALEDLIAASRRHNAIIVLDEAHSTGVIGEGGSGFAIARGLEKEVDIRVYTFGKAMGVHGACVAGSSRLIQYLVNFSRPFIYTTAPAPHQVLSIQCAFDYLDRHLNLQAELQDKVGRYLNGIGSIQRTNSQSAIQTVICPGNDNVRALSAHLATRGFDVRPIISPTVPKGTERLRICLHTFNSNEEIDRLAEAINTATPHFRGTASNS